MITLLRDHHDGRMGQAVQTEVERKLGVFERFRLFLLKRRINAMLKRTVGPHPIGRVTHLSPHLLKDIGLPPDYRL